MMKTFAPLVVAAAVLVHGTHQVLDEYELPERQNVRVTLPSVGAVRLMSMGYHNVAADYYWVRAVGHFGNRRMHAAGYPNLAPLLERTLALDPYFASAYYFAGTTLTLESQDARLAVALLQQGSKYRPDLWKIPFLLGFDAYYFLQNYETAATAFVQAARLPGAPPQVGPLAIRLAAEAGRPETGLRIIDTLAEHETNMELLATYKERRALITLEMHLKWLNEAADRYRDRFERPLGDLQALVDAGLLQRIPEEPVGGKYYVDQEGRIQTTSEGKRLRLPDEGRPPHL